MFYVSLVLAGGAGVLLRYALGRVMLSVSNTALPLGTLLANVLGCFLMGYLSWLLVHKLAVSRDTQAVVLTGFLGGFTTFSAFSLELVAMLERGFDGYAAAYMLLSVVLCTVMCFFGLWLARVT